MSAIQTPDQSSTTVTAPEHMTFIDERPLASDPLVNTVPLAPTAPLTAPDARMSAEDLLKNPILVGQFNWSPTDARDTNLLTLNLPEAFTAQDSFHRAILGIYAFLKCNLILTFKLASTRFHSGALWVVSDPMHQMLESAPALHNPQKFHNVWSDSSQPRAEIDASDSNPVEIPIPFVHVQDRLTTNSKETWDVMSQVTVRVASPLKTASGTEGTITCQVFLHCSDISLDVPIYPHTATIPSFAPPFAGARHLPLRAAMHSGTSPPPPSSPVSTRRPRLYPQTPADHIRSLIRTNNNLSQQMIANNNIIRDLLNSLAPPPGPPRQASQHGLTDSISKIAGAAAGTAWNIATGNYGQALTSAASGLETVGKNASLFNLDKPADPQASVANCLSPFSPLSHGTGVDYCVRLGNAPVGAYLESQYANGSTTDMDIYQRVQIPGLVNIVPWNTSQPVGTVLLSIPVLPSYCNSETVTGGTGYVAARNYNTNLSYISEMFVYWRMSMQYTLKVYSSSFHAGGLMCTFTPNQRLTPPSDFSQQTNLAAASFDIQGNSLVSVVCPFETSVTRKTYAPWASISSRDIFTDQHILGYLDIVVYKRLLAPSNVAPEIEIFVFQNAWSDVEFESPRIIQSTLFSLPQLITRSPQKDDADSDYVEVDMHSLSDTSSSRSPPAPIFLSKSPCETKRMNAFNEGVRDFRELSRRYTSVVFNSSNLSATAVAGPQTDAFPTVKSSNPTNYYVTPLFTSADFTPSGTPIPQTVGLATSNSFCARIARINVFYHGSMRFKVVPHCKRSQTAILSASYFPDGDVLTNTVNTLTMAGNVYRNDGYSTVTTNTSQSASLQFETPFMNGYNQIVTETVEPPTSFPPDVTRSGTMVVQMVTSTPDDFNVTIGEVTLPRFNYSLFHATGDDAVFHYPVSPPVTYTVVGMIPPPV